MLKLSEFLQDSKGDASSSRLNMLIGVLVGSAVVLLLAFRGTLPSDIFGFYMLSTGGVYGLGKWRETVGENKDGGSNAGA